MIGSERSEPIGLFLVQAIERLPPATVLLDLRENVGPLLIQQRGLIVNRLAFTSQASLLRLHLLNAMAALITLRSQLPCLPAKSRLPRLNLRRLGVKL